MESKANTALIGAFTLAVVFVAFVFIYWMARADSSTGGQPVRVVFTSAVTGLQIGSEVRFNGIKVGNVKTLALDAKNPKQVITELSVSPKAPIKLDTKVSLGTQGLTGISYVEMAGGSADKPNIWDSKDVVTLTATGSSLQEILSNAGEIVSKAEKTLSTVDKLVQEIAPAVDQSVNNIEKFTGALADNSDQIDTFLKAVSSASDTIAKVSSSLEGLVTGAENIVNAVDPKSVKQTVDNVASLTDGLMQRSDEVYQIIDDAKVTSGNVASFSSRLDELGADAQTAMKEVGAATSRIGELADSIDPESIQQTLTNLQNITAAVDPQSVETTMQGLSSLGEVLVNRKDQLEETLTQVAAISENLSSFSARLPTMGDKVENILAAVNPDDISQSIAGVTKFADVLSARSEDINQIIIEAKKVADAVKGLADTANSLLAGFNPNGDGTKALMSDLGSTLKAVRDAAIKFGQQIEIIGAGVDQFADRGLKNIDSLVNEGRRTLTSFDRVIGDLDSNPSRFIFGGQSVPEYSGSRASGVRR